MTEPHNNLGTLSQEADKAKLLSLERSAMNRALAGELLRRIWREKDQLREAYARLNGIEIDLRTAFKGNGQELPSYDTKLKDNASRVP